MADMTMEKQAQAIDAAEAESAAGQSESQGAQGAAGGQTQQQQQPAFNPTELQAFMREQREYQNRINSQLGNFSKKQSELDKFLTAQNQPKTPQSWEKLDEATRRATEELVSHIVESRFGEKFKTWDSVHDGWQTYQENTRVESMAHQILGSEFDKYDAALGQIYLQVKAQADQGNPQAAAFLKEIRTTESGVYRLVDMAKAQISQTLNAQSEKARLEQEGKAKRAATGVGGSRQVQTGAGADGLPTDKAERRKAIAAQIDEFNKAQY